MTRDSDMQSTIDEQDAQRGQTGDSTISRIRDELIQQQLLVRDDEVRGRIEEWIKQSLQYSDADTAGDYVESRLNELLSTHEMYASPDVNTPEDAFPEDCESCPHYASSCPMLLDRTRVQERERKLEDASTEREARQVFDAQSRQTGCVVVPEVLSEWDDKHASLVREGHELLTQIGDTVHGDGGGE